MIAEKKGKQYVSQIIYINQGHLVSRVINFPDEPVIQSNVPDVEYTLFVDDCK